jgi:hypothetical protein
VSKVLAEDKAEDPKKILGSPTKDLFVNILTRVLSISDAINDLIDNCIDGAKRLRPDGNYDGLHVKINITGDQFSIEDNCGGIPIDIARSYAFRFGRHRDAKNTDFSIGQFGVGMKRAFFKLGEGFYVESKAQKSEFAITVSIDEWLDQRDDNGNEDWSFEFEDDFKENMNNSEDELGTKIEINPLHKEISNYVTKTSFVEDLKSTIESKHMENIYHGINMFVNEEKLKCLRPEFSVSEKIPVAEFTKTFKNGVVLNILCGIGESIEEKGGWYIFCNDRLLLGPDQSSLTGWTGKGGGGVANYHQQFWRFRGLVYFKSENSYKLPWNTSKNNIDASSSVFLFARGKMIEMMKSVITLLNAVKKDKEKNPDGSDKTYTPYLDMINETTSINVENITKYKVEGTFKTPKVTYPKADFEKLVTISYKKPKDLADMLKKITKTTSYSKLGELTMDYFLDMEEIDHE